MARDALTILRLPHFGKLAPGSGAQLSEWFKCEVRLDGGDWLLSPLPNHQHLARTPYFNVSREVTLVGRSATDIARDLLKIGAEGLIDTPIKPKQIKFKEPNMMGLLGEAHLFSTRLIVENDESAERILASDAIPFMRDKLGFTKAVAIMSNPSVVQQALSMPRVMFKFANQAKSESPLMQDKDVLLHILPGVLDFWIFQLS